MALPTITDIQKTYVAQNASFATSLMPSTGLFANMPFAPASHGNEDKTEDFTSLTDAVVTNASEVLPLGDGGGTVVVNKLAIIKKADMPSADYADSTNAIAGLTPVQTYFVRKQTAQFKKIEKKFEELALYGVAGTGTAVFDGLLEVATNASALIDAGGTTGTDMFAIRFDESESIGLYNDVAMTNGELVKFDFYPAAPVAVTGGSRIAYTGTYKAMLGLKTRAGYVAGIEKMDDSNTPTQANIDAMLASAGYYHDPSNTIIVCSAQGYRYIQNALGSALRASIVAPDAAYTAVNSYNGVRIVICDAIEDARA